MPPTRPSSSRAGPLAFSLTAGLYIFHSGYVLYGLNQKSVVFKFPLRDFGAVIVVVSIWSSV